MQKTQTQPTIWWELERAREKASLTLSLTLSLARELFRIKEKDESRKYKEFKEELIVAPKYTINFPFSCKATKATATETKTDCIHQTRSFTPLNIVLYHYCHNFEKESGS